MFLEGKHRSVFVYMFIALYIYRYLQQKGLCAVFGILVLPSQVLLWLARPIGRRDASYFPLPAAIEQLQSNFNIAFAGVMPFCMPLDLLYSQRKDLQDVITQQKYSQPIFMKIGPLAGLNEIARFFLRNRNAEFNRICIVLPESY